MYGSNFYESDFNIKKERQQGIQIHQPNLPKQPFLSKTKNLILEKVSLDSTKDVINYGEDTLAQLLPLSSETEE